MCLADLATNWGAPGRAKGNDWGEGSLDLPAKDTTRT